MDGGVARGEKGLFFPLFFPLPGRRARRLRALSSEHIHIPNPDFAAVLKRSEIGVFISQKKDKP